MMNLTELARLPGAPYTNFEALTRAIVSRRFGAVGTLRERRQQPGVEFYLLVEHPGPLGDPGRVWGWSCKWFPLQPDNELTSGQRRQIEDSIDKAIKYVKGLSDFVLCLPQRPAKKDQDWIYGLGMSKGIKIKIWAGEEFDAELSGFDELRSTFFGELVLSRDVLATIHERSVAPVKDRWMPLLHTSSNVERRLNRALLRPDSFNQLRRHVDAIFARTRALRMGLGDINDTAVRAGAESIADDLDHFVEEVRSIVEAGRNLRPMEVRERITHLQPPKTSPRRIRGLGRDLRRLRMPVALEFSGVGAEIREVVWWLEDTRADIDAPLIAVVAAAGQGKTHLAANLTAPNSLTPGVFVQGARLRAGESLDDLAQRISGPKIERFDSLLEALNSAGARAGARIPLVLDGLNEAERPSEWRTLLEELVPVLNRYPHVAMIVTLRDVLAARVLPKTVISIDLEWHRSEVDEIVRVYFKYYMINPSGAWLPIGLFHNPLFVRMYCETANPLRREQVGTEALPTSLVGMFELYRDRVIERLTNDTVPPDQIKRQLGRLALKMWNSAVRKLSSDDARTILDTENTGWDQSIFRLLVEEGVLFREEIDGSDDTETGILFDRFAGYLIADALLVRMHYSEVAECLGETTLWESLLGKENRPFGEDVAISLVGLVPRRFGGHHLWRFAPNEHRSWAVANHLDLESELLDNQTVEELEKLLVRWVRPRYGYRHPFDRLWEVRTSPAHHLNADFLHRILRLMPLPERDRTWSEWVRYRSGDQILDELKTLIESWSRDLSRVKEDDLNALAISWLLTSTSEEIRDLATKALERFGRPEPKRLFEIATRMLEVDDLYVVERVVGAAFGAASAHQMPNPGGIFERALSQWLVQLSGRFLKGGSSPTSHELLRSYVRTTFELAGTLHKVTVPGRVDPHALEFAMQSPAGIMADTDPSAKECASTLHIDFQNYVIGPAIIGRRSYDFKHEGFRRALGEVMARVWDLGWRASLFGDVDREIANASTRFGGKGKVERYGKKYGWVAYYELIGRLNDAGQSRDQWVGGGRNVSADIDPSFPDEPPVAPIALPEWAPAGSINDESWLGKGAVTMPTSLWSPDNLFGADGSWLLIEGFLEHRRDGRRVWGFFHTLLLNSGDVAPALKMIEGRDYLGSAFFPELPTIRDVFAGEMPWSRRFEVRFDEGDDNAYSPRVLRPNWDDKGIEVGQLAVEFSTDEGGSQTGLTQSYDVPSFEFASKFGLRQLPGTMDLVSLDGVRASAIFRVQHPWVGHFLFIRRDLVFRFAGDRRILQVGWGERQVTVDWENVPASVSDALVKYQNLWREVRLLDSI